MSGGRPIEKDEVRASEEEERVGKKQGTDAVGRYAWLNASRKEDKGDRGRSWLYPWINPIGLRGLSGARGGARGLDSWRPKGGKH